MASHVAGAAVGTAFSLMFLLFIVFWIVLMLAILAGTALWIWMIIDCARRDFARSDDKVIWILVIVLTGLIGSVIYYFVVKRKDTKEMPKEKKRK